MIRVARDLIRLDTTNAREPGLGNETLCAEYLADYLSAVRRRGRAGRPRAPPGQPGGADPRGGSTPDAESLAFVGHTDVVPCDPRDWTHPPFEAVRRRRRAGSGVAARST